MTTPSSPNSAAPPDFPPIAADDRQSFVERLRRILTGWYHVLQQTSSSGAVWQPPHGVRMENFVSKSGKQCDGVARMLPALAAWTAQSENPETLTLLDGVTIRPLEILRNAVVHGTDPHHPDFWQYAPTERNNQRQVESSIIAWSIWLARRQLLPTLSANEIASIQAWLESCTRCTDLWNNWSLFFAANHAARIALRDWGFHGDIEVVRQNLMVGDETYAGDGWMYDSKGNGIDYYNFWVNGSHHHYIKAMLPEYENPVLERALARARRRFADLPYMIDARGQNVLIGRSLPYRWGWLSGLIVAAFNGESPVAPGLARRMLARNTDRWLALGSINEEGALRERLTPDGSDGGRDSYINCGHPYWGMQAFVCLALPSTHRFWTEPAAALPIEQGDFQIARQGPGLVFQGIRRTGEVRVFNFRNLNNHDTGNALYEKFVYSTAFPCNAGAAHKTCWDNQLAIRLADGSHVPPADVLFVDVRDGTRVDVVLRFRPAGRGADCVALVRSTITLEGEAYRSEHTIKVTGSIPTGAQWIEGGFALGHRRDQRLTEGRGGPGGGQAGNRAWARDPESGRGIFTENVAGWQTLHDLARWPDLCGQVDFSRGTNIVAQTADHYLLTAPVTVGVSVLKSRHGASVDAQGCGDLPPGASGGE